MKTYRVETGLIGTGIVNDFTIRALNVGDAYQDAISVVQSMDEGDKEHYVYSIWEIPND